MICSHHHDLDPVDVHDDHEEGCSGPPCSCDRPSCAKCCTTCAGESSARAFVLLDRRRALVDKADALLKTAGDGPLSRIRLWRVERALEKVERLDDELRELFG